MSKGEAAQTKTFTKWTNNELAKAGYTGVTGVVETLEEDLQNGIALIHIVAAATGASIPRYDKKCKLPVQMLQNISTALDMVQQAKVKLVGVGPQDIVDKDKKAVLALIWALIYAQMSGAIQGAGEQTSGKEGLLLWVKRQVTGFEGVPEITNFKGAWKDGLALAALIAKNRPDLIDYETVSKLPAGERIQKCISTAADGLGVAALLDASDMEEAVDDKATMTYISEYFKVFSRMQAAGQGKKQVAQFIDTQRAIDGLLWDYSQKAEGVATFAAEHIKRIAELKECQDLVAAQQQLEGENRFVKGSLLAKRSTKGTLEGTFASLQTALQMNGRKAYEPPKEISVEGMNKTWDELEEKATAAQDRARKAYRAARERVGQRYIELSNGLYAELGELMDALKDLKAEDPEKRLAEVKELRQKAGGLSAGLDDVHAVADELAQAQVKSDDIAGLEHTVEELEYRYTTLRDTLERKRKFLSAEITHARSTSISETKLQEIAETFQHFDANSNGVLTRGEFLGALKGLGRDYTDEQATELYNKHKGKHKKLGSPRAADGMSFDDFSEFMATLEKLTVTPCDVVASLESLAKDGVVTKESIEKEYGSEAAEYLATMIPAAEGGGLDVKAYVNSVFDKTQPPSVQPPGPPGSPRSVRKRRTQSMRGQAANISFANVDPDSDAEAES